jgi:hypothetical protein
MEASFLCHEGSWIRERGGVAFLVMSELRCPGCDRLVRFEASGAVRVVCDRLADGRYIVRAEGFIGQVRDSRR